MVEEEIELIQVPRGRFALVEDEGFRVVFRRADVGAANAAALGAAALVVGLTLLALLREPEFNALAWMIAGLCDFAALYVIHALRTGLATGGISVDGAERRVFLPRGAELAFERLRHVAIEPHGAEAELVLFHDGGAIRFGRRPAAEVAVAARAVARVAEVPLLPWGEATAASGSARPGRRGGALPSP